MGPKHEYSRVVGHSRSVVADYRPTMPDYERFEPNGELLPLQKIVQYTYIQRGFDLQACMRSPVCAHRR